MRVQHARRGFYYRCDSCNHTNNVPPTYVEIPTEDHQSQIIIPLKARITG